MKRIKKIIPGFLLNFYHYCFALIGGVFYRLSFFTSKNMTVIGVTGTSGKTTTVEMIARILEEAGYKVGVLSSVKFKIGSQEEENKLKMTMPGRMMIPKFLRRARKCDYVVLEVTSEGIKQYRHKFIHFDIAVLTNLSPEHIESHGSFEKYREAKLKLFQIAKKTHIINLDDENKDYFLPFPAERKYFFSLKNCRQKEKFFQENKNYQIIRAENIDISNQGISFILKGTTFRLNLLGKFNIYNALAAISLGISEGISLETCKRALEKFKKMPGRMEVVVKSPFTVIVDYAHTPNSLEKVYKTIKEGLKNKKSKMICVLGSCGGGRDKWKRPVLGEIAATYCDKVIITNEDPYDDDPEEIIENVFQGTKGKGEKILDRREAIRKALEISQKNDIVIITGKGSEPWMCVEKGKKIPWDDRQIVREELRRLLEK